MMMDSALMLDVDAVRAQFPILERELHDGKPLVYLLSEQRQPSVV